MMDAAPAQWLSSQAPRPRNDKSVTLRYFLGEGEGVGEGHSFLVPHPPQLAWATGAVRVTTAMRRPAAAKRKVEIVFIGAGFVLEVFGGVFFQGASGRDAWIKSDSTAGVLFKEKFKKIVSGSDHGEGIRATEALSGCESTPLVEGCRPCSRRISLFGGLFLPLPGVRSG